MEAGYRKRRIDKRRREKLDRLRRAAGILAFIAALALTLTAGYRLKGALNARQRERAALAATPAPPAQTALLLAATPAPTSASAVPALSHATATPAPRIVVYHTHATEAYAQTERYSYEESGKWRTKNESRNVIAVGKCLSALLRDKGYFVLHDTQNHEPPKLSSAYSRSEETMRRYVSEYGTVDYFIDVHRDASGTPDFAEIAGEEVARLMFVVGTGAGATGTGFDEMPDYERNRAFAQAITDQLLLTSERLARDVRVKTGRYNQHLPAVCLLVEVGHNQNTLEQALAAVPYLAEAIDACIKKETQGASPNVTVWAPQD